MGYLGNAPADQAVQIGTGVIGTSEITDDSIANADIKSDAAIDATKIADGTVTSAEFQYINTLSSNAQTQISAALPKAGGTMSGNIAMGSNDISGVGEVEATSLDISGDADIDGTLETDNLTVGGSQGSDGEVLTSTGSGVAWEAAAGGAGGWVKIGTSTVATSVSNIEIEHGFDSTYDVYKIFVSNLYGTSDGQWFECRLKIGGSYRGDNYYSLGIRSLSGTGHRDTASYNTGQLLLHSNQGVDGAKETTSLEITFHNPDNTTHNKHVSWIGSQAEQSAGRTEGIVGGGGYNGSQAELTGFKFQMSHGSIASATFTSYGLVK